MDLICGVTVPNNEFSILGGTDQKPGICAPVHGVDFSQMSSQCSPCAHLDSANRVDVGCDL